jgi:hypothetical protein
MNFDLRLPLGLMFTTFGLIFIGTGLFGSIELSGKSLGINLNLWWELVMPALGLCMFWLAKGKK